MSYKVHKLTHTHNIYLNIYCLFVCLFIYSSWQLGMARVQANSTLRGSLWENEGKHTKGSNRRQQSLPCPLSSGPPPLYKR